MSAAPPAEELRVLIVDDDTAVRGALKEALVALGYRAECVSNGPSALGLLEQQPFEVVLTDLGMPGMDGTQVAREVKRLSPQTQVIILTGWGDLVVPTDCVDETMTKPVRLAALGELMQRAAARRG